MATPTIFLSAFATPQSNYQFNSMAQSGAQYLGGIMQSATTGPRYAEITFPFYAESGTYTIDLIHGAGTTRGIYRVFIDDVEVGTIDGYNAVGIVSISSLPGIAIAPTAPHTMRLFLDTKNASSTAYRGFLNAVGLTRTGA